MLILPIEDFREEIKAEMYGYEEIEESLIGRWFIAFDGFVGKKRKDERLVYNGNRVEIRLKDESDLFMIVDKYLAAIVNGELDTYFNDWKL